MTAILLDIAGTLVDPLTLHGHPSRLRFTPGAAAALRGWHASGYRIALIARDADIADGAGDAATIEHVRVRLDEMFEDLGVPLAGCFICPDHCDAMLGDAVPRRDCCKPNPGLIQRAALALGVEPRGCWVVGDDLDDVEAGSRAGSTTVLLDVGSESEWHLTPQRIPDYLAHDLLEASELVLAVEEAALIVRDRTQVAREAPRAEALLQGDATAPSEW